MMDEVERASLTANLAMSRRRSALRPLEAGSLGEGLEEEEERME
jgi:hypothetical protein